MFYIRLTSLLSVVHRNQNSKKPAQTILFLPVSPLAPWFPWWPRWDVSSLRQLYAHRALDWHLAEHGLCHYVREVRIWTVPITVGIFGNRLDLHIVATDIAAWQSVVPDWPDSIRIKSFRQSCRPPDPPSTPACWSNLSKVLSSLGHDPCSRVSSQLG